MKANSIQNNLVTTWNTLDVNDAYLYDMQEDGTLKKTTGCTKFFRELIHIFVKYLLCCCINADKKTQQFLLEKSVTLASKHQMIDQALEQKLLNSNLPILERIDLLRHTLNKRSEEEADRQLARVVSLSQEEHKNHWLTETEQLRMLGVEQQPPAVKKTTTPQVLVIPEHFANFEDLITHLAILNDLGPRNVTKEQVQKMVAHCLTALNASLDYTQLIQLLALLINGEKELYSFFFTHPPQNETEKAKIERFKREPYNKTMALLATKLEEARQQVKVLWEIEKATLKSATQRSKEQFVAIDVLRAHTQQIVKDGAIIKGLSLTIQSRPRDPSFNDPLDCDNLALWHQEAVAEQQFFTAELRALITQYGVLKASDRMEMMQQIQTLTNSTREGIKQSIQTSKAQLSSCLQKCNGSVDLLTASMCKDLRELIEQKQKELAESQHPQQPVTESEKSPVTVLLEAWQSRLASIEDPSFSGDRQIALADLEKQIGHSDHDALFKPGPHTNARNELRRKIRSLLRTI